MTGAGGGGLEYRKIYLDINKYINIFIKIYFDKCCFILMYFEIFHVLRYILLNYILEYQNISEYQQISKYI